MQIVAYASKFKNAAEAFKSEGGRAIIGVFFQITTNRLQSSLSKMGNLLSVIRNLTAYGSSVAVNSLKPDVLLPDNKDEFFRYLGSLTHQPCIENVQWTVMRHALQVTNEDVSSKRHLPVGYVILQLRVYTVTEMMKKMRMLQIL
ncbi:unnamed protein product [Dibothriocephalus latus]|uniref:carbonic anhydrase n=1 Tax=Dibothriocephalus latus TaxID=60516 RepID=A0A3P6PJ88_DIBLA|nr:unnamed protein product [Dibothriocephalus latus]